MKTEITPQLDVVQQQQIQALLANVEELTHQNEEQQKTMEPKMQNVSEQMKTKMKKNQTLKPTGETELQEKTPPGWRMSFTT